MLKPLCLPAIRQEALRPVEWVIFTTQRERAETETVIGTPPYALVQRWPVEP
jgi:hypothetical protein